MSITPTRRACLLAAMAVGLSRPVGAETRRVSLATATPGGGFPAYGEAFATAIRAGDPDLAIDLRASGGSAANLGLLRGGAVDLALVQGEYAYPALGGGDGLRVFAPMYPTPGLFVVPAGSPIRTVADLRGRTVALGTRDSGLTVMGRAVLAASGLDPERDLRVILLDRAGDGPELVTAGRADALWGGGLAWPGFLAMAEAPGGARFLGPDADAIARLDRPGSALRPMRVPAGTFAGQDEAVKTVGSWSLILARPGFEEGLARALAAALARGLPDLARLHAQGASSDPAGLPGLVPEAWIAAGTARYLAGLAR